MILIIYILGFVSAWFVGKKVRNKQEDNSWAGMAVCSLLPALFSWVGLISVLLFYLITSDINNNSKPPKWL